MDRTTCRRIEDAAGEVVDATLPGQDLEAFRAHAAVCLAAAFVPLSAGAVPEGLVLVRRDRSACGSHRARDSPSPRAAGRR